MQTRFPPICLLVGMIASVLTCVRADIIPGVDWYIKNTELLLLVHAPSSTEKEAFVPTERKKRLVVEKVLKGFTTQAYVEEYVSQLKDGQRALVLYQYEYPAHYAPVLRTAPSQILNVVIWPIGDKDHVLTDGINLKSGISSYSAPTLADVINYIAEQTPEEIGLCEQAINHLLALPGDEAVSDPKRKRFLEYYTIIHDLGRDVPMLAGLLESTSQATRTAAQIRLEVITGHKLPVTNDSAHTTLHLWSQQLVRWWEQNENHLFWDSTSQRWMEGAGDAHKRRWPPVPPTLRLSPDEFPPKLLKALEQNKTQDFAPAFQDWLDSGVMRDRQIWLAASLNQKWIEQYNLFGAISGGGSPCLPPAPRFSPEVIFSDNFTATDRMKIIALVSHCWHYNRFTRERTRAIEEIENAPMDAEFVRRAAFWEMIDENIKTVSRVAINRIAPNRDPDGGKVLLARFLAGPTDELIDAARQRIATKDKEFINGLLQYTRAHRDSVAQWTARVLCQSKQPEIIPVMVKWLKDSDPRTREMAAFNLCWIPSAESVPGLLRALEKEKIPSVKERITIALAQTGDRRVLDPLLAAAREIQEGNTAIEIARGLSRIKDARALSALAEMAIRFKGDDQAAWDIVNAFGYISGKFKGEQPHPFWSGSAIEKDNLKAGLSRIAEWMKKKSDS